MCGEHTLSFLHECMQAYIRTYIPTYLHRHMPISKFVLLSSRLPRGNNGLYRTVDENYSYVVHMVCSVRTYKVLAMPIGAGCCPSTVCTCFQVLLFILIDNIAMYLRVCLTYLYHIYWHANISKICFKTFWIFSTPINFGLSEVPNFHVGWVCC